MARLERQNKYMSLLRCCNRLNYYKNKKVKAWIAASQKALLATTFQQRIT
jgi:hypothetical protein